LRLACDGDAEAAFVVSIVSLLCLGLLVVVIPVVKLLKSMLLAQFVIGATAADDWKFVEAQLKIGDCELILQLLLFNETGECEGEDKGVDGGEE